MYDTTRASSGRINPHIIVKDPIIHNTSTPETTLMMDNITPDNTKIPENKTIFFITSIIKVNNLI